MGQRSAQPVPRNASRRPVGLNGNQYPQAEAPAAWRSLSHQQLRGDFDWPSLTVKENQARALIRRQRDNLAGGTAAELALERHTRAQLQPPGQHTRARHSIHRSGPCRRNQAFPSSQPSHARTGAALTSSRM